ncbi:MliC family protein [Paraburkholderia susongensis]|uniref:Membrane-bound lysozyme-inhibitor of c-type lysozyme n=1 Tax=Paraburkholderia susongensis TaxID=1515439 RepID=A0A1X7KYF1_9BURK|nr:MliC family protein [Paraburkholderia susongensis]SMG46377.1 Membrane-bound lysozyme-inhibitor of c-type lysozyme [Paraburkholderia susongensis]
MKTWLVAVLTAATAGWAAAPHGGAWAAPLQFRQIEGKNHQTRKYTCATGKIIQVTYWNAQNGQSFAVLPVKGTQMLFVNTISASGAKYEAGSYTWWTKGPRANLYDTMSGENAPPLLSDCVTVIR